MGCTEHSVHPFYLCASLLDNSNFLYTKSNIIKILYLKIFSNANNLSQIIEKAFFLCYNDCVL